MLCATCASPLDPEHDERSPCPRCAGPALLDGRYRLLRALGCGAYGMTYEAARLPGGERVAIKELSYRAIDSLKSHELFEREARVLRQLDHPNIPRCHEDFVWGVGKNQALYLVEDLIDGHTLSAELERRAHDEAQVLDILEQLLDILVYLHSRTPAVIHRDIKPDNVMRALDGRVMLIDFGAVRDSALKTHGSTMVGTFGYMAPELFRGEASAASDIYAAGALAAALLTRAEPHALLDPAHALALPASLPVSAELRALLSAMLAPAPAQRPDAKSALAEVRRVKLAPAKQALTPWRGALAPATARGEESLFGLSVTLALAPLLGAPCMVAALGLLPTLSVLAGLALLTILSVPFIQGDEG